MRRDALLATAMAHCSAGRAHINRGEVAAGCDCLSAALSALGAAGRPALAPSLAGAPFLGTRVLPNVRHVLAAVPALWARALALSGLV